MKEISEEGHYQNAQYLDPGNRVLVLFEIDLARAAGMDTPRTGPEACAIDLHLVPSRARAR